MKSKVVGVVMAGGFSRRFGEPKAFAVKNGKYFFQYSLHALQPISEQVIIVTNKTLENKFKETTETGIITDLENFKGKGPLAGLYTVMEEVSAEWYAVAPVDTPFIESDIFNQLKSKIEPQDQAMIAVANERIQPLVALYHSSLKPVIKKLLERDQLAIQALLDQANTKYVSFTETNAFININVQRDYNRYIKGGRADEYT